jgi:hypothetical protein
MRRRLELLRSSERRTESAGRVGLGACSHSVTLRHAPSPMFQAGGLVVLFLSVRSLIMLLTMLCLPEARYNI